MSEDYEILDVEVDFYPGAMKLCWSAKNRGFGEILITHKDDNLYIDSEYMSREFVLSVLAWAIAAAKLDHEERKDD